MEFDKNTIIESRTDIRVLSALAKFYVDKGSMPRTRSSLVSRALEDLVFILEDNKHLKVPTTKVRAAQILEKLGFPSYKRKGKPETSIVKDLQIESIHLQDEQSLIQKAVEEGLVKDEA